MKVSGVPFVRVGAVMGALMAAMMGAVLAWPASAAAPSESCDTETLQAMAPADTTVNFAAREFGGGCRVHGYVTTRNPGPNKVLFVLSLPDNFNGRYLYLGVGGGAGALPVVSAELYRKGYAMAGSDGGSGAKSLFDFSFRSDPAKAMDFAWRGVHVSAAATAQITRTYYKRNSIYRYISGCSGGGHMGLANALRFGREDFDGFIVGATPLPGSLYLANMYRIAHHLQNHPEGWISPDVARKADAAILARYDEADGARDGVITDGRDIGDFDIGILRQIGFTPAQIATFDVIRKPHRLSGPGVQGDALQPGFSVTNVAAWTRYPLGTSPPPWPSTATTPPGEVMARGASPFHVMADTQIRAKHPQRYYAEISDPAELTRLTLEAGELPADFGKLVQSGAKMVIYHGVNDEAMSYLETIKSYEELEAKYPDSANWLRVFPVAGLMHCRGGIGPTDAPERLLEAVARWVEEGRAPDTVVASRSAAPMSWIEQGRPETVVDSRTARAKDWEREFRLCAEPARVVLKKPGLDPKDAENWICRVSQ